MKIRKMRQKREGIPRADKMWTVSIAAAFAASIAIFGVMVGLEKEILTRYEKGTIYTAVKQIPKGQLITEKNIDSYFQMKELDKSCIPQTALNNLDQVKGLIAAADLEKDVLLTLGMFEEQSEIMRQLEEPVIAGFKAEDLYQVAGGVLRAGDRIHIYTVKENGETAPAWKEVYVQQVFDASGTAIANDDKVTAAQRINVYLSESDVETFYYELANGALRVVKECN